METFSRGTSGGGGALNPWYVTGFCEGQGAFTFSRNGRQVALYFSLKRPMADRALLEEIRGYFGGIGKIYPVPSRSAAYFRACRRDELPRVVAHFDRYPMRGAKAESYRVWRELVELKQAFRKSTPERVQALASQLSSLS
jgi:hypothetical protein